METGMTLEIVRGAGALGPRLKRCMDNSEATSTLSKRQSFRNGSDGEAACLTTSASTSNTYPSPPSSPPSIRTDGLAPMISELSGYNQIGVRQVPQYAPDRAKTSLSRDSVFRAKTGFRHLPSRSAPEPVEFITPTTGLFAANSYWPAAQAPPIVVVTKPLAADVRAAGSYTCRPSLKDQSQLQSQLLSCLYVPMPARRFAVAASWNNFRDVFGQAAFSDTGAVAHDAAAGCTPLLSVSGQQESDGMQLSNSGGSGAALVGTDGAQTGICLGSAGPRPSSAAQAAPHVGNLASTATYANDGVETDLDWGGSQAMEQRRLSVASSAVEWACETSLPSGKSDSLCGAPIVVTGNCDSQLRITVQAAAAARAMHLDSRIRDFPRTCNRASSSITDAVRATFTGSSAAALTTPGADAVSPWRSQGGAEALPLSPRPWQPAPAAQLDAGCAMKTIVAGVHDVTGGGCRGAAHDGTGRCGQVATVDTQRKNSSDILILGGPSIAPEEVDLSADADNQCCSSSIGVLMLEGASTGRGKEPSADAYKSSSGSYCPDFGTSYDAELNLEHDLDLSDEVFDQVIGGLDDKILDLCPDLPENLSDNSVLDGDEILLGNENEALTPRVGAPEISQLDRVLLMATFNWW